MEVSGLLISQNCKIFLKLDNYKLYNYNIKSLTKLKKIVIFSCIIYFKLGLNRSYLAIFLLTQSENSWVL